MSFFAPAFLIGLAGLSLPVLIHFLRRKKLQVIPWAAHRFLIASIKRNKQRLQFEDLLLLLLRCLLLALIVLAFARPFFKSAGKPGAAAADNVAAQTVLLVDHSASTGWSDGVRTRLDEIRELADAELTALPGGAGVAVIAYSDRVMPVIARPTRDLALVRRELARLHPVSRGSDLAPALRAALDLLDTLPRAPR
ncbi:MAG: BatA domain-containing protein, partial [Rariglobus sp.]|nr:BatA domain-containing protein [Rariglobus sp.]